MNANDLDQALRVARESSRCAELDVRLAHSLSCEANDPAGRALAELLLDLIGTQTAVANLLAYLVGGLPVVEAGISGIVVEDVTGQ